MSARWPTALSSMVQGRDMGHNSPSHYRRLGRNAYSRGVNPDDRNPYRNRGGLVDGSCSHSWREGWDEEKRVDEAQILLEQAAEQKEEEEIEEFARLYRIAKDRGLLE